MSLKNEFEDYTEKWNSKLIRLANLCYRKFLNWEYLRRLLVGRDANDG
jgi:hypothetical protein